MATTDALRTITLTAGADLSSGQYKIVQLSAANTVTLATASTQTILGVLVNAPGSGEAAEVAIEGVAKVIADGSVAVGDLITADSNSVATSVTQADADSTDAFAKTLGIALEADAAANAYIRVLLGRQSVQTA